MVRDKIVMVMAYVKLILGKVVDNYKMPLLNNDMQFSSVGRMPTDEPIKDTRSDVYLQLGILSMDVSMDMKTQVVCKTFHPQRGLSTYSKTIKEALRSFKDHNFSFVKQSANQIFISLARKFDSQTVLQMRSCDP